ncbi:CdaR family protein [Fictibacillus phosphorivorans]|uniref:CdaR family protein n=1 Tax=Fictibacillus phosphorivorans TaxID=1221500 RepID=UPI00203F34DD|nr:CdaR family protein [Fictibacillus phosphorivorans]MCM3719451.1 CdaR family protein [Fictibacillus phosphorivorans]MCM3777071.1 CdaR family protein [Fictibacillus phosphorivorans]
MDKLLNSSWFVKIIAFLLALMMYTIVTMETQEEETNRSIFSKMYTESETIQDVEITPYFNEKDYVLTDLPSSVDITLTGSSRLITKAIKVDKDVEAYIDLTNEDPGNKRVKVNVRGLPEGVKAKVKPEYVDVMLHKKVTKKMPVNVDLKNVRKLPEGYTAGDVEFSPRSVNVTGPEGMINQISFITGFVDVGNAEETIETKVPLRAYNQQGDLIDVQVNPETAKVTVPISKPKKTVPISVRTKGELEEGLSLASITTDPNEITLTGTTTSLEKYDTFNEISIDLSKIKKDTTLTVDVPVPEGIDSVSVKEVNVSVDVDVEAKEVNDQDQEVTRTFKDVPLTLLGTTDEKKATIIDPVDGTVDVTVKGKKSVLDGLQKSDLKGVLDISQLEEGTHEVKIDWKNPADIDLTDTVQEASVEIQTETSSQ